MGGSPTFTYEETFQRFEFAPLRSSTIAGFSFMETEENSSKPELSQTPELDADLPEKGIPRLVIEKLVLENFKSYAGVKVRYFSRTVISRKLVLFIRISQQLWDQMEVENQT